jgi:hypothetical protein
LDVQFLLQIGTEISVARIKYEGFTPEQLGMELASMLSKRYTWLLKMLPPICMLQRKEELEQYCGMAIVISVCR